MRACFTLLVFSLCSLTQSAQQLHTLNGILLAEKEPLSDALVHLKETGQSTVTDSTGKFTFANVPEGKYTVIARLLGYEELVQRIEVKPTQTSFTFRVKQADNTMQEVVVTGNLREMKKSESPVPVEIYSSKFFLKNPTPNVFEAMTMVNGVRPQLNCNVCNTGDIHINGMEGPYTMVLIDGMPIVSSLSTIYGLSGIPNSMIERVEVVKGPASSLYGSEAMAGLINIITKNPLKAPLLSADVFATSYGEVNADLGVSLKLGRNVSTLLGLNYFNLPAKWDLNKDGFTDVTLQNRFSVFNKWEFRKNEKQSSIAVRYLFEDRWGGQLNWNKSFRGSDSLYGESILTHRFELIGNTQLPVKEKINLQYSYNYHNQNSYYGVVPFMAKQHVAFTQLYWDKNWNEAHYLTTGASFRYIFYDDNTVGTKTETSEKTQNKPQHTYLPGIFSQYEFRPSEKHRLLLGLRYDYNLTHGSIFSPRLSYKWSPTKNDIIRFNFGNGYRVVNLFTEDHAALSGSREVIIAEALKPEQSYNGNINYQRHTNFRKGFMVTDVSGFYTHFVNKIIGDFDSDPNKIIYTNLKGYAVSAGATLNTEVQFDFPLRISAGITYNKVYRVDKDSTGKKYQTMQIHAPEWSGTYAVSYTFTKAQVTLDWNGQWSGPMRLPVLPNDFRPKYSPWHCLMNIQATKKFNFGLEIYAGIKNLLNFMPQNPLMRPHDPFNKTADDAETNPNGYVFDTAYNYAPLQGVRGFAGVRYNFK
ncbi:MAG: TonB-dependent receptor [Chitinophagales bacterium]|nr:TonB-dependent receptor [Chitinophagales bacterium]